jgi:uncharacterized membrane protein YhaH (DUF805 family)
MVYSILMLFNFAHGDIFMVGAYIGVGVSFGLLALTSSGILAIPNWLILVMTILISMFLTLVRGHDRGTGGVQAAAQRAPRVGRHHGPHDRNHPGDGNLILLGRAGSASRR